MYEIPRAALAGALLLVAIIHQGVCDQRNSEDALDSHRQALQSLSRQINGPGTLNNSRVIRCSDSILGGTAFMDLSSTRGVTVKFIDQMASGVSASLRFWQVAPSVMSESLQRILVLDIVSKKSNPEKYEKGKGKRMSSSYVADRFWELGEAGLISKVAMRNVTNKLEGDNGWTRKQEITAKNAVQGLYSDFEGNGSCVLRSSWPLRWMLTDGHASPVSVDIRVIPVTVLGNGVLKVASNESLPNWSTLRQANLEFLQQNGFEHDVFRQNISSPFGDSSDSHIVHHHRYKTSPAVRSCTLNYVLKCGIARLSKTDRVCLDWGQECGIQDLVKINRDNSNLTASHIFYGIGSPVRTASPGEQSQQERDRVYLALLQKSLMSGLLIEDGARIVAEGLNKNFRHGDSYEPSLEPAPTSLTYLIG